MSNQLLTCDGGTYCKKAFLPEPVLAVEALDIRLEGQ